MSNFRLQHIKIDNENFQTDRISFVNQKYDQSVNHFTLIVGNNGTGKSRILGSIAKLLKDENKSLNTNLFNFSEFEKSDKPKKIISISNSISDKFPLDNSYRNENINYKEEKYNYIGLRGNRMGFSPTFFIRRSIDILLENYSNNFISKCYRHVFDYLEYKPLISLEYYIRINRILNGKSEEITPEKINEYMNDISLESDLTKSIFENLYTKYKDKFPAICDFLNKIRIKGDRKFVLDINFSESNIEKIGKDKKKYEEDVKTYEILNILRKLKIINGFDIKLVNKENQTINFSEASSGETSILITLIALIPLVENNSCILIDEPEISLHPSWQYKYIELLTQVFDSFKGCHIIIASHSHFLISDLPTNNSSVVTLNKENGVIKSKLLDESTFGWSAEDILLNVFKMPTTRNYYITNIVSKALELIATNKSSKKEFEIIKKKLEEIEPNLKEIDPLKLVINTILNIHKNE